MSKKKGGFKGKSGAVKRLERFEEGLNVPVKEAFMRLRITVANIPGTYEGVGDAITGRADHIAKVTKKV